tara:strand:+ start:866 stop:3463 length:2598 start_codon:yes stop_codon:yes gene_type:complete
MFGKKKKKRVNTFKTESNERKATVKKSSDNSKRSSFKKLLHPLYTFIENDRNRYITGLTFLSISFFLTFSFVSYFFSWKIDQDKIEIWSTSGFEVFNENYDSINDPENHMGTLGAKLSNIIMNKGFGVFSFCIPFFLFCLGAKLAFNKQIFSVKKTFWKIIPLMIWGPTLMAFIFKSSHFNYGGSIGVQINIWLNHISGTWGVIFILLFFGLIISRFSFNYKIENLLISLFDFKEKFNHKSGANREENITLRENTFKTILSNDEKTFDTQDQFDEQHESKVNTEQKIPDEIATFENSENTISETNSIQLKEESIELDINSEDSSINKEELSFEIEESNNQEELLTEAEINEKVKEFGEYDPTLDLSEYQFPKIDLLNKYDSGIKQTVDPAILEENKNNIVNTLKNYKIEIDSIKATIGPTITLYEIVPAPGVRISKIKNLEDDIALSLAALGIRIIAPIPGKGTIGIEVPNPNPDIVSMHTAISSKAFQEAKMELPLALGKTITNETFTVDLTKMPHLLMAGATGQGKSVGLNAILVSLLYRKHPSELKLILVDPKKVELTLFNKVYRHFLAKLPDEEDAIITDTQKVVNTVNSLCVEMDERYELLKNAHCRNIKEYNFKFKQRKLNPEKGHKFLPYIVLVIDEFADLIMTAGKEIETPIARLAQLARAIGIHLIVATQRPSVNIITGTIKANFPARIAFRVTSKIDSRTILDAGGADQLIGRGDMLLSTGNDLIRIQCAFVDTPEVEKICEFIGEQRGYPDAHLLPEYNDPNGEGGGSGEIDMDDRDDKFEEAARIIVLHQQGSASLLQRKLKLGYNRAGRIVDQLEAAGIIGPFEGSKARQVLIPDEITLEQKLIDIAIKQID